VSGGLPPDENKGVVLTAEETRRQRSRSVALGLVLGGLVLLFFVVTLAKLGGNVANRPL
jgi:hypothetical protein